MNYSKHSTFSQKQIAIWYEIASKERFPGKVTTSDDGLVLIKSFITLPANNSTSIMEFRIPDATIPVPKLGDFVTFRIDIEQLREDKKQIPTAHDIKQARSFETAQLARHLHQKFNVDSREYELEILDKGLKKQKAELEAKKAEIRLLAEEQNNKARLREEAIKQNLENLQQREEELSQREFELNQLKMRLRPFLPNDDVINSSRPQPSSNFSELFDKWPSMLCSANHIMTKDSTAEMGFLLSLLTTLQTGGLVILDGPVGVGKTSIVKRAAKLLSEGDGAFDLVSFRPGWIDSTDLVGFYDPIHREFQPSVFITALNRAGLCPERLHLICLDELNLARIENYGADLLSCMEYRQDPLLLYSLDIEHSLKMELKYLTPAENTSLDPEGMIRVTRLGQMLQTLPAEFQVPSNAVIIGTLNSDETTYDISPKVIDRSFVVRMPIADLTVSMIQDSHEPQTCVIDFHDLRAAVDANRESQVGFDWLMEELAKLQEPLKNFGIPLGHRVRRDLEIFTATAQAVGLENVEEIFKYFLFLKILPRIRYQKSDHTRDARKKFQDLLKPFQGRDPMGVIENLERQWDDPSNYSVRFFNVVQ